MRILPLSTLALGMLLASAPCARAGFFDACMAPGSQTITVAQDTVVRSEKTTLRAVRQDSCNVEVLDGVSLTLQNVGIEVVNEKRVNFIGGDTSTLSIQSSTIHACDNDIFGFKQVTISSSRLVDPATGLRDCDVKEFYVTGDVAIRSSLLTAEAEGADADIVINSRSGDILVQGSTLTAQDDIRVEAVSGGVTLQQNRVSAVSSIAVRGAGPVRAQSNVFQAGDGVTISGSPCTSQSNTPPVPCT